MVGTRAAEIAEGTGSRKFSAERSANAQDVHRQGSVVYCQQDVRMRDDPMSAATRYKSTGCALLIASSVLLSIPVNAQTAHKASKSAKASVPVLPAPAPVLEPKAIEILKAAC